MPAYRTSTTRYGERLGYLRLVRRGKHCDEKMVLLSGGLTRNQTTIAHLLRIMMEIQDKEATQMEERTAVTSLAIIIIMLFSPYAIALLTPQNNIQCSTSIKPIKAYTTNCSRAESLEGARGEKFALGGREGHHLQREMRAGNQRTGAGGRQGDPSRAPGRSTTAGALYSCDDRWRVGEKMASNDHWVEEVVVVGGDHWVEEAGVVGGDHWVEEAMVVGGDHMAEAEEMVVGDLDEYTAEAEEMVVGDSDEYTAGAQEILEMLAPGDNQTAPIEEMLARPDDKVQAQEMQFVHDVAWDRQ
ncbi:hypothetical protein F5887DRAFT_1165142 [Amanita rubescens]|nr:hypothetical protein F5887DRAFT_1165142 [Amanita rubescens]